jgi:nucleoside-diphosphate-sugar epimerase
MILVTGGTGFLGAHLVYRLLQKEQKIRVLKRENSRFDLIRRVFQFYEQTFDEYANLIEWVDGDLLDIFSLEDALDGISNIYHTAALVSFHRLDHANMKEVNIRGTANLVNVALDKKVSKFCHVSSIAALGRADNNKVIDENNVWKTSDKNSAYAVSKYGSEKEIWRGIQEGLHAFIVNPSIILGPGEINSGTGKLISTVLNGLKFYTTGINGFVDVRDVVRIMTDLMEKDTSGERFIVSAQNLNYRELFHTIAQNLGKQPPAYRATRWMGAITWRFEHLKGLLSGNKPLITRETAKTATNTYVYSNEKIKKTLDYEFIPVAKSIGDACEFYKKTIL